MKAEYLFEGDLFLNYVLTGAKIIAIIIFPQYLMTERQKPVRIEGIESDPRSIQHSSWTQLLNSLQV